MYKLIKKSVLVALLVVALLPLQASAAANTITLTSSTQTVRKGETFQVDVNTTTDTAITAAQVYITFDKNQLAITNVDYSTSPLTNDAPDSGGGEGYYRLQRYKIGQEPAGTFLLGRITFEALASSGTATVSIDRSQSEMGSSGPDIITAVEGTSVELQPSANGDESTQASTSTTKKILGLTPLVFGLTVAGIVLLIGMAYFTFLSGRAKE